MATEMSIPLTLRERRMADRNYEIGDSLMVLASFANHELTTMMLQLNCEDCGELETATVIELHYLPQFLNVEFGD
jgi:hypothetical protein